MIVKFSRPGASFRGLALYLTHDPKAETSDRVAWTHTLNLANDHIPSAVDEMYRSYHDAELLKDEAGVKRGGRTLEKPVKHVSLNWRPEDEPTKAHMIETAESFLSHMGWSEHQAIIVAHNDKDYEHLHIELNTLHPETGLKLDESLERRRAQVWRREYVRSHEQVHNEQRETTTAERDPTPTRPAWQAMKEAEKLHNLSEEALRARAASQDTRFPDGDFWTVLKQQQREEREAFFAGGKEAYKNARDAVFREVREEFREDWRDFYAAKRDGLDGELLADIKAGLVSQQQDALAGRRDEMAQQLRAERDEEYAELLAAHRAERANLKAHLALGGDGHEFVAQMRAERSDLANPRNDNDPLARDFAIVVEARSGLQIDFSHSAAETCTRHFCGDPNMLDDVGSEGVRGQTRAEDPRARDSIDVGFTLGAAAIGGALTIGEHLFEGFLDNAPRPKARPVEIDTPSGEPPRDLFAAAADSARRRAEQEAEDARRNEWWYERRSRTRD